LQVVAGVGSALQMVKKMKKDLHVLAAIHFSIFLVFLSSGCPKSHFPNRYFPDAKSPEQVVELFQKTFGTPRMDEIGPYTTENFRDNLPITVWINKTWHQLNTFGYEKTAFKLLATEYNDLKTLVKITVATKINSAAVSAAQKEIYLLIKEGDCWLIDELIVTDEKVDAEAFGL
jgi:hypothetical protein